MANWNACSAKCFARPIHETLASHHHTAVIHCSWPVPDRSIFCSWPRHCVVLCVLSVLLLLQKCCLCLMYTTYIRYRQHFMLDVISQSCDNMYVPSFPPLFFGQVEGHMWKYCMKEGEPGDEAKWCDMRAVRDIPGMYMEDARPGTNDTYLCDMTARDIPGFPSMPGPTYRYILRSCTLVSGKPATTIPRSSFVFPFFVHGHVSVPLDRKWRFWKVIVSPEYVHVYTYMYNNNYIHGAHSLTKIRFLSPSGSINTEG